MILNMKNSESRGREKNGSADAVQASEKLYKVAED